MSVLPFGNKELRLAMLGMVEGNGHPYSWASSSMVPARPGGSRSLPLSGHSRLYRQAAGAYAGHRRSQGHPRLDRQSRRCGGCGAGGAGAQCRGARRGCHRQGRCGAGGDRQGFRTCRARPPFIEAGIPMFIDGPLSRPTGRIWPPFPIGWPTASRSSSSSAMRYAKEYVPYHRATYPLGQLRHIGATMAKSWEAYGIHALGSVYPIVGPGFVSVQNIGDASSNIVHLHHRDNVDVLIQVTKDMLGGFGMLTLAGTAGQSAAALCRYLPRLQDAARGLCGYLGGIAPDAVGRRRELMQLVIAGIESREQGGRKIYLSELETI